MTSSRNETHLRQLNAAFPDHAAARLALANTLGNALAPLRRLQGNVPAAKALFAEALAILEALHRAHPDDAAVRHTLGDVRYEIGLFTLYSLDDAETAAQAFEAGAEVFQALAESQPEASLWRHRLAVLKGQGLVTTYKALGRLSEAQEANRQALALLEILVREEPSNNRWAHGLAWELLRRGDLAKETGDQEAAARAYRQATEIHTALLAHASGSPNFSWLDGLAYGYESLADVQVERGALARALASAEAALAARERMVGDETNIPYYATALATAGLRVGELRSQLADVEGARQALTATIAVLGRIDEAEIEESFVREQFAETSRRLEALLQDLARLDLT